MPTFWRVFIINGCWFCQKLFLHLLRWSLQFVNMVYHIDWFVNIEKSLHPWDKFHLIMVYDPFNVLLDSSLLIFCWGFLHLYSLQILTYIFCGLACDLFWRMFHIYLKIMYILLFLDVMSCYISTKSNWYIVSFKAIVALLIFFSFLFF